MRPTLPCLAAVLAAGALLLTACGGSDDDPSVTAAGSAAETTTTKEPFTGPPIEVAASYADFFVPGIEKAAEVCKERYDIPVKVTPVDATYEELNLKLQVQAQGGQAPDLAVQGLNTVTSMGTNPAFVDLAPLTKDAPEVSADVIPALKAGMADNRLVSIPWGISLPVLWINDTKFKAAGLDPAKPFATLAEMADAARRLTKGSQHGIATAIQEGYMPLQYLLANSTNLVKDGKPAFADPNGVAAAKLWTDLLQDGTALPGNEDQALQSFLKGKTAIYVGSTSYLPQLKKSGLKWSALPFPPAVAGEKPELAAGGAGISMLATEDRRAAATDVLRCLFDPSVLKIVVDKFGYLPVRTDIDAQLGGLTKQPPFDVAMAQYGQVSPWYAFPGPDSARANQLFLDGWTKATQRSKDPAPVLAEASKQVGPLLP